MSNSPHHPACRTPRDGHVVVLGAGMIGQLAAILLARDGHRVTLLERDAAPPPAEAEDRWTTWQRRGVTQFRLPHLLQPRFHQTIQAELPGMVAAMEDAGCLRFNALRMLPAEVTGGYGPGDERFDVLTGRRPVIEGILARIADETPGLTVRRGSAATRLLVDDDQSVPHVVGVGTSTGKTLRTSLVVDAAGRRSPLGELLGGAGVARPVEEIDDVGYVYYSRDFRNHDETLPALRAPVLQVYDSISIGTFPADRGCWSVVIVASAEDRLLRAAKDVGAWQRILDRYPLARHWTEADQASDVVVIRKLEDRWRDLLRDGRPVATGVVSVGDAWACTNPSVGRGIGIGTMHAVALRDHLRDAPGIRWRRRWPGRRGPRRRWRHGGVTPTAPTCTGCARSRRR